MKHHTTGGFTLPGEAGCEALTLELAKRWGADVIRWPGRARFRSP